jgi:hypothetical protein
MPTSKQNRYSTPGIVSAALIALLLPAGCRKLGAEGSHPGASSMQKSGPHPGSAGFDGDLVTACDWDHLPPGETEYEASTGGRKLFNLRLGVRRVTDGKYAMDVGVNGVKRTQMFSAVSGGYRLEAPERPTAATAGSPAVGKVIARIHARPGAVVLDGNTEIGVDETLAPLCARTIRMLVKNGDTIDLVAKRPAKQNPAAAL